MVAGFTPAQIYEFNLAEVADLFAAWRELPPVAALVAGFVGFKPPSPATEMPAEPPEFEE